VKQNNNNNVGVKRSGWLGVDLDVAAMIDRFCCRTGRAQTFRQELPPHPSSLIPYFLQKHPTSLSTSLHHPTLTLPVWPIRVTRRASSTRRRFLSLKRFKLCSICPSLCCHLADTKPARAFVQSPRAQFLSIDQHTTRNTRVHQPSPRATTP
jgi:hypothetical protein